MHILHALFTSTQGGLEQSYIDVTEALAAHGHRITALLHPLAPYRQAVAAHAHAILTAKPRGFYDLHAAWHMRGLLKSLRPDLILAHNARAIALLDIAGRGMEIPLCGVSHGYKTARVTRADALIVLTPHMRQHFIKAGYPESHIEVIPNLIRPLKKTPTRKRHNPVVIGAMGRMSDEKGFADLLHALQLLDEVGVEFSAQLAGEGPELMKLKAQAESLGLTPHIEWKGWVEDKAAFFRGIDMLCVPSHEESFGLVILEAMAHGVPVVATDAPGPVSIIKNGIDGLIVPRRDVQALANALQLVMLGDLMERLSKAGLETVKRYDFACVAQRWDDAVTDIIAATSQAQAA